MTRRVFLTPSGLLVSKPGFDVTAATGAQLSLDSRIKMFSVYLQGSIALSAFTTDSDVTSGGVRTIQRHYTLNFGRTFPSVPICLVTCQDPMQSDGTCTMQAYQNSNSQVFYGGNNFAYGTGGQASVTWTAATNALRFDYYWNDINYSPPNPAFFNYTIVRTS